MTTSGYLRDHVLPTAYALLPPSMQSPQATALLLTIALQESRCEARRQVDGPARGFWQFEIGGVRGVCAHPATAEPLRLATIALRESCEPTDVYVALEHNDVLAAVCARLLLWTLPQALPPSTDPEAGWQRYVSAWRPGKPRRSTWDSYFAQAWEAI